MSHIRKRKWAGRKWICLILIVCLSIGEGFRADAIFSEEMAVHIIPGEIEQGTLLIGTHLIHISALTDSIYTIAKDSASESGQYSCYYKSELAGGVWMDITDASGLDDISAGGKIVKEEEIASLWLTHHTKSDQITYDLLTGKAVNPFTIQDPYDLKEISEFDELLMQYEQLAGRDDLPEEDAYALILVNTFLAADLEDEQTKKWDEILAALQRYKEYLIQRKETQLLNLLDKIMESVDASRRAAVYEKLSSEQTNGYLTSLQKTGNENLVQALSNCMLNAAESYYEYSAKGIEAGNGVLGSLQYTSTQELFQNVVLPRFDICDLIMWDLFYLDHIENGIVGKREEELYFIQNKLLPAGEQEFAGTVNKGVSGEYTEMSMRADTVKSVLQGLLKAQKGEGSIARMELQFIVQAAFDRMEPEDRMGLISARLETIPGFEEKVPQDAYTEYANQIIRAYEDWLRDLSRAAGGSEEEKERGRLEEEKEKYLALKASALDKNNLAHAQEYDVILEGLDEMISGLGGSSQPAVREAKEAAVDCIDREEFEEAMMHMESMASLVEGSRSEVMSAMKDIYKQVNTLLYLTDHENSSYADIIGWIEAFVADNSNILAGNLGLGQITELAGEYSGTNIGNLGTEEITKLMGEYLGTDIDQADAGEQAAVLAAVVLYGEHTQDDKVGELAAVMAKQFEETGNPYLFKQCKGVMELLPTKAIGACLGYRYLFDHSEKKVTLSQKGTYYYFYANRKRVEKNGEAFDEMNDEARYQSTLYIDEEYAYNTFGCQAVYLPLSDKGILVTDEMMDRAEELFAYMIERGSED